MVNSKDPQLHDMVNFSLDATDDLLSLRELRKALNLTQKEMAERLNKGQDTVSRIEQRYDLLLSTLQSYIRSLGGELDLVCRFKGRDAVRVVAGPPKTGTRL
jgi:DNA-binding XRE family transcriptional regulator